jgi:hypothetical protein
MPQHITFNPLTGYLIGGGLSVCIGIAAWFLKRVSTDIRDLKRDTEAKFLGFYHRLDSNLKDISNNFNLICNERQTACSKLVHEKFDHVKEHTELTCRKLHDLEGRRSKRWEKQETTNKDLEKNILRPSQNRR